MPKQTHPAETTNSYGAPALAQQGGTVTDFTIGSLDDGQVSLADYEGDVIIMNFWATWCPPCRAEMPGINNFYEAYKDEGLVVLAINEEEPVETVRPFIELNEFSFPVLLDIEGRVAQQYSTRSFPTTFIIDRQRRHPARANWRNQRARAGKNRCALAAINESFRGR